MKYNVSYQKNEAFHSLLANAENELSIRAWFQMYEPNANVVAISAAISDDDKPGKSFIEVSNNILSYMNAAKNMSSILEREKYMSCRFYVMDKGYINNLAYPEMSADNHGDRLRIGKWYVIVKCANGHLYYVDVTEDSVVTMCVEVFDFIQHK